MLTNSETPLSDIFGQAYELNWECEFCGRSLEGRFGGVPNVECDSCRAEFALLNRAGKLEIIEVGD